MLFNQTLDMVQFKVIIAGGRNYDDYTTLRKECDRILSRKFADSGCEVVIVSGGATGADALGEQYASEKGLTIDRHPADWKKNGRAAGPIRNAEMADVSDALIAFWDGQSRGTKSMIDLAQRKGLQVAIVRYDLMNEDDLKDLLQPLPNEDEMDKILEVDDID